MRRLPKILVGVFLAITLWRVAEFSGNHMNAGALGWLFSIGLGASVYLSAYWTRVSAAGRDGGEDARSRRTRLVAWFALISFMAADGYFNLQDVLLSVTSPDLKLAAWIYGLFPTTAAALLGILQGNIDRLPAPPKRRGFASIRVAIEAHVAELLGVGPESPQPTAQLPQTHPQPAVLPAPTRYDCELCGKFYEKQTAYAAHMSHHARKNESVQVEV